jgi:hypothetical protein
MVMVSSPQNVFNHEPHNALAHSDTKRFGDTAQVSEECCERLGQAQECSPIVGLVGDRLQLSTKCVFAMAQRRHALSQLFDRQESFLVFAKRYIGQRYNETLWGGPGQMG